VGVSVDDDDDQWRRLTGDATRDLSPMTQSRMQQVAAYLWEANALANRLIELPIAYLLAEGVRLTCPDETRARQLDRFWSDPINRMDERLPEYLRSWALFGELALPAYRNEMTGRVRLGWLDPALIETVVSDPDNPSQPIGIVTAKDRKGRARRYRVVVVGPEEECFTRRTQEIRSTFADGEIIYQRINALPGGMRGRSDLLSQADWLDGYDMLLFGELDRASFLRSFVWDVTLKGATPEEVAQRARTIAPPKPGAVRVHNDAEIWGAVTPGLQAADLTDLARLVRNHVLGGATLPEHWYGGGGDVNRAVGAEMGEPTMKIFSVRQRTVKHMLELIGRYVLWAHETARGDASVEIDWSVDEWRVEAVFPEMSPKDTTKYASALQQVVVAAGMAVDQGRLSEETALRLISAIAGRLGVEIDAQDELGKARADGLARRAVDTFAGLDDVAPGDTAPPQPAQEQ
jgi:hypothetical protein